MTEEATIDLIAQLTVRLQRCPKLRLRLHLSDDPKLEENLSFEVDQKRKELHNSLGKPMGIWWGINTSWLEWILENAQWFRPYLYTVHPQKDKLLQISNLAEFDHFEQTFKNFEGFYPLHRLGMIDWDRVTQEYQGMEIDPYLHQRRLESFWYYGWDCASGCSWHPSTTVQLLAFYDETKKRFSFVD